MRTRSFLFAAFATSAAAFGQFSTSADNNLAISTNASDQNQPKIVATADGGSWVSWFDGIGTGWDVRIQRLDQNGYAVFPAGGLLVADRSFSSTQDYELALTSSGDALLAYRTNAGGSTEIEAARVTSSGAIVWRTTVTSGAGFVAAPSITGTGSTDEAVVGWIENSTVRFQGLDAAGAPRWGAGTVLTPPTGSYSLGSLCASTGGGAIASIVHQTGSFSSPRHLVAQRLDDQGTPQWGTPVLPIFTAGSLQFGNFPECVPHGAGGAAFVWYSSGPSLQCFAQVVDVTGQIKFTLNGQPVSANATRLRTDPAVHVDIAEDLLVYWRETNLGQSQSGLYGQRLDGTGARQWGGDGIEFVPLSAAGVSNVSVTRGLESFSASSVVYYATSLSPTDDVIRAVAVNGAGDPGPGMIDISTAPGQKARLAAKASRQQLGASSIVTWSDERSDAGDIYAQSLGRDRLLGQTFPIGELSGTCGSIPNSTGIGAGTQAFGSTVISLANLTLTTDNLPANTFGFYLVSRDAGFAPNPGGSQGVLCLGGIIGRLIGPGQVVNSGAGGSFSLTVDPGSLPQGSIIQPIGSGETWRFQSWYRDNNPTATSNFSAPVAVVLL